jgi:UDP-N-acetylmuramoyl-tripeptide--D-alanyl-D-alanine ligase
MPFHLSLSQLSEIIGFPSLETGEKLEAFLGNGITTDSRILEPGQVFLALRGESFDGHDFVDRAIERGAIALIVDHQVSLASPRKIPVFLVKNTLETYQQLARWWRDRFSIPVIAVTGSVGKTTTKELIASVLATQGKVHKTIANYNNEIGVPKTLLELEESHTSAVIEMGMRGPGEIALLSQITRPTIAVITNVGTAHIGRLGSEEAIAAAKCELLEEMPPTGMAIFHHDNPLLLRTATRVWRGRTLTYGLEGGDLVGHLIAPDILRVDGEDFPLPLPGRHNALNYLGAIAVAKVLGYDLTPLRSGLTVTLPGSRSRRYPLAPDILLLDETYNAGLESMLAALELLQETPGKRHIAVLGAMKELGEFSDQLHRRVGERVKKLGIDRLFVLVDDPIAQAIAEGAIGIETDCFVTREELIQGVREILAAGDRVLFKASNSVGLNAVVEAIAADSHG